MLVELTTGLLAQVKERVIAAYRLITFNEEKAGYFVTFAADFNI